ncbi:hypothetical protein ASPWEDRAFT_115636 [Aspergillus wentii DTO 134E9]|uniref:Rhodopsin domain-containing protein n=1 Tax=Aspergillus wentii DTO 134E9 TaxID=1073089 RepID=A0A1L9RF92_ASPWE|nr:uncharacterized protein ASPWEDRAFT_115636 [Aspergillus wentii DTO 134E9]KAI9926251.1 hypothetical protein MW887_004714 [Aspergillus wentii]OJJ33580.1 hypothetical protein ASPWEDRAFT_115636 [Aspergillus wentii DTO 134E9]
MALTEANASDDKGPKILAVLWTLTGLTAIMVIARLFIRSKMLRNMGLDDYLIAVSMVLGLGYCGITSANVALGYGKHAYLISQSTLERIMLLNNLSFLIGILSFTLPKLAVTAMLNRILNPTTLHRCILWFLTGSAATVSCICIIILFTMCNPPKALWQTHLMMEGATCKSTTMLIDYAIFTGALSAVVDLYLAFYPTTVLMKLHMSLRKRMALCAALGLGSIASAMAIVKCTQLKYLADKSDYTYGTADLVMWTNIESNVVIIASCIPTLQPLLELLLGKRELSSYNNSRNKYKNGGYVNTSSFDRSKRSTARKQPTDLTITGVDSQENILHGTDAHNLGQIRRTDNVTVQYESREEAAEQGRSSW